MTDDIDQSVLIDWKDATITYNEIKAGKGIRKMNERIKRTHPTNTKQGYDFRMNLDVFGGDN